VDPYYLTAAAEQLDYRPEVILAGRRINDSMGAAVAQKLVKLLALRKGALSDARVGVLGLTFKPDVPDIRNSKVPDILAELREYGIQAQIGDPLANAQEARHEYGLELAADGDLHDLDALVLAVDHHEYIADPDALIARIKPDGLLIDVKSALSPDKLSDQQVYWSL
jgi:UDP-N-acetyl-D-galactosamine dehydrogenase